MRKLLIILILACFTALNLLATQPEVQYEPFTYFDFPKNEKIVTYPLIYKDKLFVLSTYSDLSEPANIQNYLVLYSYDLTNNMQLLWRKQISQNATVGSQFNLFTISSKLMAVFTSYKPGGVFSSEVRDQLSLIDTYTGDIKHTKGIPNKWDYKHCKGKWKSDPNSAHFKGVLYEFGSYIYASVSGTTAPTCSSKLFTSDIRSHWKASQKEPILINNTLFTYLTTTDYDKTIDDFAAVNLTAVEEAKRGCDTNAVSYRISFQKDRKYLKTGHPVIHQNHLYFPLLNDKHQFVFAKYNAKNGHFVEEIVLQENLDPKFSSIENVYSIILDNQAYIYHGLNLHVVSLASEILPDAPMSIVSTLQTQTDDIVGSNLIFNSYATGDYFYTFSSTCLENCNSPYAPEKKYGKIISQYDIMHKTLLKRYTSNEFKTSISMQSGTETSEADTITSRMLLFYKSHLYVITTKPDQANHLFKIPLPSNDNSKINKLQYRFNNSANQVAYSQTNENPSTNVPQELDNLDHTLKIDNSISDNLQSDDQSIFSIDKKPTSFLVYNFYESIEPTFAYIPLLDRVYFSSNGDPQNNGEGKIKVRSIYGCQQTNLTYPYRAELNLYEYPSILNVPNKDQFLTFTPNIPMMYSAIDGNLVNANRGLTLTYTGYENDTTSVMETIVDNVYDATMFGIHAYLGNVCGMISSLGKVAKSVASSEDELYGSPHLLFTASSESTNFFGIPKNTKRATYQVGASASVGSTQTLVNTASGLADLACMNVGASESVSDNFKFANAAGSILLNVNERHTLGTISVNKRRYLPVKSLKIVLNKFQITRNQSNSIMPVHTFTSRIGILGEDEVKTAKFDLGEESSIADTPFTHYVRSYLPNKNITESDKEVVLYQATFNAKKGLAGFYLEVGQTLNSSALALYSETRFFEEILFGAWDEVDLKKKKFSKKIVKAVSAPELDGQVHLTFDIELANEFKPE